ncbi:MAG: hypothetical protein ACOCRK_07580 [bacterium]
MKYNITKINSPTSDSDFGQSVAIHGNYLIVGDSDGRHYIYKHSLEEWNNISSDIKNSDYGYDVDIYNDFAVIGYPSEDEVNVLYKNEGGSNPDPDSWESILLSLQGEDTSEGDGFGKSVAIYERYIAIGAPNINNDNGAVYIFKINEDNSISQIKKIIPSKSQTFFGISVSINDKYLVVGAENEDVGAGASHIFKKEDNEWVFNQKVIASDRMDNDNFGSSVAIFSKLLIIGAPNRDYNETINAGGAYIYKLDSDSLWYEISKIDPPLTENNNFENGYFGSSVSINKDYAIIGGYNINNGEGGGFIYSRLKNWNLVEKIDVESTSAANVGSSVDIDGNYFVIGATNEHDGAIWIIKRIIPNIKVSQSFEVYDNVPTKASLYLNRIGNNLSDHWVCKEDEDVILDASNFLDIKQSLNKIILRDDIDNSTGNGCMVVNPYLELNGEFDSDFGYIIFPIKAIESGTYNLWLRNILYSFDEIGTKNIDIDILIDDKVVTNMNYDSNYNEWNWGYSQIILPDNNIHYLGIRMKNKYLSLDKIYITKKEFESLKGEGPDFTTSPFITVHLQVFSSSNFIPVNQLLIYDHKNTVNDVIKDGWYNFDIRNIDDRVDEIMPNEDYCIVLSTSGDNSIHFLSWEHVDNIEYLSNYSAIKY